MIDIFSSFCLVISFVIFSELNTKSSWLSYLLVFALALCSVIGFSASGFGVVSIPAISLDSDLTYWIITSEVLPSEGKDTKNFVVVARGSDGRLVAFRTDNLPPSCFKYVGIDKNTKKDIFKKYPPEELSAEKN